MTLLPRTLSGLGLLLALTRAGAADYLPDLPAPPRAPLAAGDTPLYLELVINGQDSGRVVPVQQHDGHYLVDAALLRESGLQLPGNPAGTLAVDQLPGLQAQYDSASQQLRLQAPPDWLPTQRLDDHGVVARVPARSSLGALFNYDLYYAEPADDATPYLSALLEQRVFDGFGVIANTGVYNQFFGARPGQHSRYLRYDTSWSYDDDEHLLSYQLGDYISGALNWTNPVRLGGVRLSRDFGIRPDLVTYPLLHFDGQAAVPSTVDLFINGYRNSTRDLSPGPFNISNVPYINGAGEATVVTTDAQGRQVATTVPFYVSNTLLAKGLSDFDVSVGSLRRDYGVRDFGYGEGAASGIYRVGYSDRLTLSVHGEAAGGLSLGGAGADVAVGTLGTLSLAASQSGTQGQQYLLGYSYYSRSLGLSLQHIQRSGDYRDLSSLGDDYQLAQRSDQATASLTFGEHGTVGAGYFDIRAGDGSRTRLANLSFSRSLGQRSSLYLSLNKDLDDGGYSALLQWILPFDVGSLLNVGITRNDDHSLSERVVLSRSVPSEGGLGWNLGYGGGASHYQQADLTWRLQNVQLQGGLYGESGNYTRWADASGSLVWMDGATFASNRINDAFVLVSTQGYPDVPVLYENQRMGSTDADGHLLVPWVSAYYPAKFQIEPLNLPANVSTRDTEQRAAVRQGSGLLLDFPVRTVVAASLVLQDADGNLLPLGSQASELHSGQHATLGWDGQVYFEGLQQDNLVQVRLPDGSHCQVRFSLDTRATTVSQVGPLTCLPTERSQP
ncbi:MAG: Outer membrane usher protein YehB [Pseudomonas citronellolis]|nr:MAG: Outer membrane usher protein YehB [Pseudomonas citronellolis]